MTLVEEWLAGAERSDADGPTLATSSSSAPRPGRAAAAATLRAWARRAPLILVRRAAAVASRLATLAPELAAAAPTGLEAAAAAAAGSPQSVMRWVARDPRVLLTTEGELERFVAVDLPPALLRHRDVAYALAAAHPSYLILQLGALVGWVGDVCHLLQVPGTVGGRLAADPQVGGARAA